MCDNQGNQQFNVKITDVALVPDCAFNLFSLSKRLKKGWSLHGNANALTLSSPDGACKLRFDIKITTPNGVLFAICMKRSHAEHANVVTNGNRNEKMTKMSVLQAHEKLGHINARATVQIAESLGWKLTGNQTINCASCAAGKAKQKSLNKVKILDPDDEKNWYRAYLDISTVRKAENMPVPPNPNWRIIVLGTNVQLKFSHFFKSKNNMVEPTCKLLHRWGQAGIAIKKLRMDNAGENIALEKRLKSESWKNPVEVEYTARDTPQQNSVAEVAFYALANKARAAMHQANLPVEMQFRLFGEIFTTITLLDGLTIIEVDGLKQSRYEHVFKKKLKFVKYLRTIGEAGTVKITSDTTPKLQDRGIHCIFVGYSLNHPEGCYRMYDPATHRVRQSRDVVWLHRMFYEQRNNNAELNTKDVSVGNWLNNEESGHRFVQVWGGGVIEDQPATVYQEENDPGPINDELEENNGNSVDNDVQPNNNNNNNTSTVTTSGRISRQPARLIEEMGETALTAAEQNYYFALSEYLEYGCVGAGIGSGIANTNELKVIGYDEAMQRKDKNEWMGSINEKHDRMLKNKVWMVVKKKDVPKNADIIDSTWAMKKKANGQYRARLAARGFKQTHGKSFEYHDISSPVVHDITVHIVLTILLMSGWAAHIVDVNGAFLLGEFKENEHIYMKVPKGFECFYSSDVLLYLRKTLYGVKNAAKAFWRLLLGIMNSMGYKRNHADPCLYYKWDSTVGLIMWISFIDDMLVVCNEKYMDDVKQKFTNTVDCDDMGAMVEYIGTKIDIDKTKCELKITQPVLVQSLRDEFEFENPNNCPETPAPASTHLMASGKSLSPEKQTKYRSGVGKLLFF